LVFDTVATALHKLGNKPSLYSRAQHARTRVNTALLLSPVRYDTLAESNWGGGGGGHSGWPRRGAGGTS